MKATLKISAFFVLFALAIVQTAGAEVLWSQTDFDVWGAGFYNSESGMPPFGMTVHTVCDATIVSTCQVSSITMYFSAVDPGWGDAISGGYLHIYPKTGALPTENPALAPFVAMTGTYMDDHIVVTASGLTEMLAPGDYWMGITPVAPEGFMGPEICLSAMTPAGTDFSASYDVYGMPMPMWMNFNPGVDAAILVEGEIQVANESSSWGAIKGQYK